MTAAKTISKTKKIIGEYFYSKPYRCIFSMGTDQYTYTVNEENARVKGMSQNPFYRFNRSIIPFGVHHTFIPRSYNVFVNKARMFSRAFQKQIITQF
jgi:hypothetical protein